MYNYLSRLKLCAGVVGGGNMVSNASRTPITPIRWLVAALTPPPSSLVHIPRPTTYGSLTGALACPLVVNSVHEAVGVIGDGPSDQSADQDGQQATSRQTRHHFHLKTQRI